MALETQHHCVSHLPRLGWLLLGTERLSKELYLLLVFTGMYS